MKRKILSLLFLTFIVLPLHALDTELVEQKIFQKVNVIRKKQGLPTYMYHKKLQKIARYHTKNMVEQDFFSHTDHNGQNSSQRALELIPELIGGIGENIAYNYGFTEEEAASKLMNAWMNSPGHRANILSKKYNYIGVGVVRRGERIYSTQNFGDIMAELTGISDTKFTYESHIKMKFKYLASFDKSKLNIFIYYPDKNAKHYTATGTYYTGMGKYTPHWIDDQTFEIDIHLKYGKGNYGLKMGKSPYVYKAFDFNVR